MKSHPRGPCTKCGVAESSTWRGGAIGIHLCNACGVAEFGLGKKSKDTTRRVKMEKPRRSTRPHYKPLEYWRNEQKPSSSEDPKKWLMRIKDDGGRHRTLCCHPFNAALCLYGKYQANHISDCGCPIHREGTYWRRLSTHMLAIRTNALKNRKDEIVKKITGMNTTEYLNLLTARFRQMFNKILNDLELNRSVEDLSACAFYSIDEWLPRCSGKIFANKEPWIQAEFFAKVFSCENTRLLLNKKEHAELLGVCCETHKDLINGMKIGKISLEAELNFSRIEPSKTAIEFWHSKILDFTHRIGSS